MPVDELPTAELLRSQALESASEVPDNFRLQRKQAQEEEAELRARLQFLDLQAHWSNWLIGWITGLLILQIILAISVGRDALNYEKYQWFLPMVIVQNFGQIIGMGYIIVKFLYPNGVSRGASSQMDAGKPATE